MSAAEAVEAAAFFDVLALREIRGEVTTAEALAEVARFGLGQLRRRRELS